MVQMNLSNTLWNDDSSGTIALAEQLKDRLLHTYIANNPNYSTTDKNRIPAELKAEVGVFQEKLNEFFLDHWVDFQRFLLDEGVDPETIDSWKEVQEFLEGLPDDETMWLKNKLAALDTAIAGIDQDGIGIFDVSAYNNIGGTYATYNGLSAALAAIPTASKRSGMTIRYIDSTSNQYEEYRYFLQYEDTTAGNVAFNNTANWQGIDDEPKISSDNLVKSGGVQSELALGAVYDVSAKNPTAGPNNDGKFESLSALLSNANLSTLIPIAYRKGGMSIKFVCSSDNKYVQFRCKTQSFSANSEDWAVCGDDVFIENPEFIKVYTDSDDKILWAIKPDGTIYYGAGVPPQVIEYIQQKIDALSLDEYEDIVTFLGSLIEGDKTLAQLLNEKVDKEEGKSLIDAALADSVQYVTNPEFVYVKTDSENKILFGIKVNGEPYFGVGCPEQVKEYVEQKIADLSLDEYGNIVTFLSDYLEGDATLKSIIDNLTDTKVDKVTGKSLIDAEFAESVNYSFNPEYIKVVTDNNNKILYAVKLNGDIVFGVGVPDDIKTYIDNGILNNIETIKIPVLNSNFVSPVDCDITGTKGDSDAKYVFHLPLSDDSWNIRFRFRVTENLHNQNKSATIASINGLNIINTVSKLVQQKTSYVEGGVTKQQTLPNLIGGILYNGATLNYGAPVRKNSNLGKFAFSIRYTGSGSAATITNDGTKFSLTIDGTTTDFPYSTYTTIDSLYAALSAVEGITMDYNELETRNCADLATFTNVQLKLTLYGIWNGEQTGTEEYIVDNPPIYISYAVDDTWHTVEIVKIDGVVYAMVDGVKQVKNNATSANLLVLGGECGVLFKDLIVSINSPLDAEHISYVGGDTIFSSWNPHIVVLEGHGMVNTPTYQVTTTSDNMNTNIDRLQRVFTEYLAKGYVPVSIQEIAEYYTGNCVLPKRCFTIVFDDFEWSNFLDLKFRSVFTKFGIKPALAIISDRTDTITYHGVTLTKKEAAELGRRVGFDIISHTRNHRYTIHVRPSEQASEFTADIYSGDDNGLTSSIIVYPYGVSNNYMLDIMQWMGFKLGISVFNGNGNLFLNTLNMSRYAINREEIGFRVSIENILEKIV